MQEYEVIGLVVGGAAIVVVGGLYWALVGGAVTSSPDPADPNNKVTPSHRPSDVHTQERIRPEDDAARIKGRSHMVIEQSKNLPALAIGLLGLCITFYFTFLANVTAHVSVTNANFDVVNMGLLSRAERGAMFGICVTIVGLIQAVRGK